MNQPIIILTEQQLEDFAQRILEGYKASAPKTELPSAAEIITPEQLCKRLAISKQTQIRFRKKGKIPWLQIGTSIRYNWQEVLKALNK